MAKKLRAVRLSVEDANKDFSKLLNDIVGLDDSSKCLWLEIYNNATSDRQEASRLFQLLREHMEGTHQDAAHAMHGQTLVKYLERMHRCNEQLIKLSELVMEARKKQEELDPEEAFARLERESSKA